MSGGVKLDWVQLIDGTPVRIFKNRKAALRCDGEVACAIHAEAVTAIRKAVYKAFGGECRDCGAPLTYEQFEMHEQQWRGKGGEVSVWNSVVLCHNCHTVGKHSAHGSRLPRFGEHKK